MKIRTLIIGAILGATLAAGGTAIAANVVKRFQGTVAADRFNGTVLAIGGTDITATATEVNYTDVTTAGTAQGSKALVLSSALTITGISQLQSGLYKRGIYPSVISSSQDLSTDTLLAYNYFRVTTNAAAVDIDIGEDDQFAAALRGSEWIFALEGGSAAMTVTAGTTVSTIKLVDSDGTSCEDEGDYIRVMVYSTAHATVTTFCAD